MSLPDVLVIHGFPEILDESDLNHLMNHFGAVEVRKEGHSSKNHILAKFRSHQDAQYAMHRLHQLEVVGKRLSVKYANFTFLQNSTLSHTKSVDKDLTFGPATKSIALKIAQLMLDDAVFYRRVRKLMLLMNLKLPSESLLSTDIQEVEMEELYKEDTETEESELESEGETNTAFNLSNVSQETKTNILKKPVKRPRVSFATNGKQVSEKRSKLSVAVNEIFERQNVATTKKLKVCIQMEEKDEITNPESLEKVEGFGKFAPATKTQDVRAETEENAESLENEQKYISKETLLANRMPSAELNLLPVLKNYSPGEPSSRLYIKNLAKQVKDEDLRFVYGRYVSWTSEEECNAFDIRLMTEGRMKGQAFVTLPNTGRAQEALNETHGYVLHGKPLVVQFARSAKAKENDAQT